MPTSNVLSLFSESFPSISVRAASEEDEFEDLTPLVVTQPRDANEVALILGLASQHDLAVSCRGSRTKSDWGGIPRRTAIVLDLSALSGIAEHNPEDLVVRVRAGTPLALLQKALGEKGQRLPVDEVVPGSTVGGVIATGISGPSRYGFGTVRDLLIGCSVVLADGTKIRAGSKVVKNVAGYDLSKLIAGSFGTLGVLTEATLRLRPLPQRALYVRAEYGQPEHFALAHRSIVHSQVAPTAIELEQGHPSEPIAIIVALEGRRDAVSVRADVVREALGGGEISEEAPEGFGRLSGTVVLKVTSTLRRISGLLVSIGAVADRYEVRPRISGSAGAGVLYLGLDLSPTTEIVVNFINEVRKSCMTAGGSLIVLRAPTELKRAVDIFGEVSGLAVMEHIKDEFDPMHLLAPGRFVGAI